jgi:hypothetical protein
VEQRRTGTESAEFYSAWKNDYVITEHQLVREAIVKDYISGLIPKVIAQWKIKIINQAITLRYKEHW